MMKQGLSEPECPRTILGSCEKCPASSKYGKGECDAWRIFESKRTFIIEINVFIVTDWDDAHELRDKITDYIDTICDGKLARLQHGVKEASYTNGG